MALGRGLSELLGEVETAYENNTDNNLYIKEIDILKISVNPYQPRKIFDEEKLKELSSSILSQGLMQPIILIKNDKLNNEYILVAGERRLRASKLAQLQTIKSIILDINENQLREYALIENIQRDDLNIIEVAYSYAGLINEYNITHEELSIKVFKSRSSITNTLRLLTLSVYTQEMISASKISQGHAKLLVSLDENNQKMIVDTIIGQKLSVKETDKLIKNFKVSNAKNVSKIAKKEDISYSYELLNTTFDKMKNDNLKIKIDNNTIKISINSQEDINNLYKYFS
jgi:ParB family chromosome partitioning protein